MQSPRAKPNSVDARRGTRRRSNGQRLILPLAVFVISMVCAEQASAQLHVDEEHRITWHAAADVVRYRRPAGPAPVTVASDDAHLSERLLPLDEAIRIALDNAEVIRVLAGVSASSSGRTIYDTAMASTPIDQATARFDPVFSANSAWRKTESPGFDFADPATGIFSFGSQSGGNDRSISLQKTNRYGGSGSLELSNNFTYSNLGATPTQRPVVNLSYTHPLLAGSGRPANEAPIVIARLQRSQSYFQFKGSIQELLRGVISAYWSLVEARTQLWAREKQVEQAKAASDRVEAQFRAKLVDIGDVAQPKVALANFRANLVAARGSVIQREAALRNLLGLPPENGERLVPSTPPTRDRVAFEWEELYDTAQLRRPDLIELNLVLHADYQRLIQASNSARPTLNVNGIQRWNGLSGRINGNRFRSDLHDNPSWQLAINFEVPLTLRDARANVRSQELLIARDRANIQQGLHAAQHSLATTVRNLDQFYEQYEAFKETRVAARLNLKVQAAEQRAGRVIFLNVLQAITDWGNAVTSEASSLTQYNSTLAALENETGTILDTHGVVFVEERFCAVGPLGKHYPSECYPRSLRPQKNTTRYTDSDEAAENAFDLENFPTSGKKSDEKPYPDDDAATEKSGPKARPTAFDGDFPIELQPLTTNHGKVSF